MFPVLLLKFDAGIESRKFDMVSDSLATVAAHRQKIDGGGADLLHRPRNSAIVAVCDVPEIGSKIRRRHRVGRGRYSYLGSGGRFVSKISDDNQKYVFFVVSGGVGVFIPWAANTGVRPAGVQAWRG